MTKRTMIERLVRLLAPGDAREQARLRAHHAKRPAAAVRESLGRWEAVEAVTDAECRRHCQLSGLPRIGK
jgi:hypothetical protein